MLQEVFCVNISQSGQSTLPGAPSLPGTDAECGNGRVLRKIMYIHDLLRKMLVFIMGLLGFIYIYINNW